MTLFPTKSLMAYNSKLKTYCVEDIINKMSTSESKVYQFNMYIYKK